MTAVEKKHRTVWFESIITLPESIVAISFSVYIKKVQPACFHEWTMGLYDISYTILALQMNFQMFTMTYQNYMLFQFSWDLFVMRTACV